MMSVSEMHATVELASARRSPEVRLLERVRDSRDSAAWAEFVDVYQPVLSAFVRRNGVPTRDVPDVVQDILARLVQALTRFEYDPARGQFRTWLWRITSNAATNWSRKQASRVRAEAAWYRRRTANSGLNPPDERDQVQLERILNQAVVEVRQTTLPATWACFEGQVLHGRSAGELAMELGVSANAVYVNTCRVRARVREQCLRYSIQAELA
jgi:RNA polymerase sigma-70 factor (ECF subfamily)